MPAWYKIVPYHHYLTGGAGTGAGAGGVGVGTGVGTGVGVGLGTGDGFGVGVGFDVGVGGGAGVGIGIGAGVAGFLVGIVSLIAIVLTAPSAVLLFATAYSNANDATKAAAIIFIFFMVFVFWLNVYLCHAIIVPKILIVNFISFKCIKTKNRLFNKAVFANTFFLIVISYHFLWRLSHQGVYAK